MLLVKTYLDKSSIHGIGLFAAEPIRKGTLIWKYVEGFDFAVKDSDMDKFPKIASSFVLTYGYLDLEKMVHVVCVDDARFFNHSLTPNTDNKGEEGTVALRDIQEGEELTCNYFEFDGNVGRRKVQEFGVSRERKLM